MNDNEQETVEQIVDSVRTAGPGRMSLAEFVDSGLLQEANRLFFHPRGIALAATFGGPEDSEALLLGPILVTDDPEGWAFGAAAVAEKTVEAHDRYERCREAREALFGPGGVEPVRHTLVLTLAAPEAE